MSAVFNGMTAAEHLDLIVLKMNVRDAIAMDCQHEENTAYLDESIVAHLKQLDKHIGVVVKLSDSTVE